MSQPPPIYASLDEWISREAISFALDSDESFSAAVDSVMAAVGGAVELLGLGEPMHGCDDFLAFRNRLFQRLVEAHGFTAIALESSFPRARFVDLYVAGGGESYDDVRDIGFSHGFGRSEANRALVEWMRAYNGEPSHDVKLRFYGFDGPLEMMYSDSPRALLQVAVDYLASIDTASGEERRRKIESLLGEDAPWETQEAAMDPSKSIGLSPAASALRLEVEDFIAELRSRRPELVAAGDESRYAEAVHHASAARHLLTYHAGVARSSSKRLGELLGVRDLMMADNLMYMVERERTRRGRVLAFAHNSHVKVGQAQWQLGPQLLAWWPAGSQMRSMLGARYAVIGVGVGTSEEWEIGQPGAGTLEARLTAAPGPARLVPTHGGQGLPAAEIAALPTRTGIAKNPGYFPFTSQSVADFDWLAVLDSVGGSVSE